MHLPFTACKPPPALSTRDEQMKDLTPKLWFLLAMYEGLEAGFDIAANKPIFGELPLNKQMLVNAWIELHKEELMANWHAGRLSGEFFKLDPLR